MKLLDLFCGAGGAAMGYHLAGFEVVGVDIAEQPNYPFEFYQADALDLLPLVAHEFDVIHASPPCQAYSALNAVNRRQYPDLATATRAALLDTARPYVLENVAGSPVRKDLTLCGEMFGLAVIRHRFFEVHGWTPIQPDHKPHRGRVAGWPGCGTANGFKGPMSPCTAKVGARARWPNGRQLWAFTGPMSAKRSPRRSRPPTPTKSASN